MLCLFSEAIRAGSRLACPVRRSCRDCTGSA
jgi:hypothetical protein